MVQDIQSHFLAWDLGPVLVARWCSQALVDEKRKGFRPPS